MTDETVYETDVQAAIMVEATKRGHRLMRNNVGVARNLNNDGSVRYTKFGVGGKGAGDLVGWTRKRVFIGRLYATLAVYTMVECKRPKGARERAKQEQKLQAVRDAGGIAGFCRSVEDYVKLIGET